MRMSCNAEFAQIGFRFPAGGRRIIFGTLASASRIEEQYLSILLDHLREVIE